MTEEQKLASTPKREPDIHPTLHLLFSEWAFLRGVEIVPESKTGTGNLDFAFVGHVNGEGPTSICVEVKHAHADDLVHGLEKQLPAYMEAKAAKYGAYVVVWYRGETFDRPTAATLRKIKSLWVTDPEDDIEVSAGSLHFILSGIWKREDIRIILLDVSTSKSASRI